MFAHLTVRPRRSVDVDQAARSERVLRGGVVVGEGGVETGRQEDEISGRAVEESAPRRGKGRSALCDVERVAAAEDEVKVRLKADTVAACQLLP